MRCCYMVLKEVEKGPLLGCSHSDCSVVNRQRAQVDLRVVTAPPVSCFRREPTLITILSYLMRGSMCWL